jgi:ribosomal protein S18 acetylase RimI-like enzyme
MPAIEIKERGYAPSPNVTNFVAKNKEDIVGSIQLVRYNQPSAGDFRGYWLFSLSVKGPYRRLGIGERLALAVINKARAEGAQELSLLVREDQLRAIRLYRKLGFRHKVIPSLEVQLEKEKLTFAARRVIMSKILS